MIALVSYYNDACLSYGILSDFSKIKYAKKWGHKYFLHRQPFHGREPQWNKIDALLSHFKDADYLLWIDADAFIVNQNFDVSTLLGDKDIYMSKDCNGWNNGVFALRTSQTSSNFLNDCRNAYQQFRSARFKEQSCMGYFMDTKYKDFVKEIPVRTWNSYDDVYPHAINNRYQEGDFILHLPNEKALNRVKKNYRVERFADIIKRDYL